MFKAAVHGTASGILISESMRLLFGGWADQNIPLFCAGLAVFAVAVANQFAAIPWNKADQ